MLKRQKHRPEFTGGIEAKLLKFWHIELFKQVKPKQIFFAYDTPDDLPPLEHAAQLFKQAGYGNRNILRCYTLIGYPGDTFEKATQRLETVKNLGFCPMAMLYMDFKGEIPTIGVNFNARGLDLPLFILQTGIIRCWPEYQRSGYSVFASIFTRFKVKPEH